MNLVIIETPYAGDVAANTEYAKRCLLDSLNRNEAPFASHLLYTQVLDDTDAYERRQGIRAGLAWGAVANLTAVYVDRGISHGMQEGIAEAKRAGRQIVFRTLATSLTDQIQALSAVSE